MDDNRRFLLGTIGMGIGLGFIVAMILRLDIITAVVFGPIGLAIVFISERQLSIASGASKIRPKEPKFPNIFRRHQGE